MQNSQQPHRRQHVRPFIKGAGFRSKRWLEINGRFAIGDGGIELLKGVRRDGSLAVAAKSVGWSYRHAWGYIRRAELVLQKQLMMTRTGKGNRRGSSLTPFAVRLLREFEKGRNWPVQSSVA